MTRHGLRIVVQRFDDGYDGVGQWIDENKIRSRRLDQSPTQLKRFLAKFKYVILSSDAQRLLKVPRNMYFVPDFLAILLDRR